MNSQSNSASSSSSTSSSSQSTSIDFSILLSNPSLHQQYEILSYCLEPDNFQRLSNENFVLFLKKLYEKNSKDAYRILNTETLYPLTLEKLHALLPFIYFTAGRNNNENTSESDLMPTFLKRIAEYDDQDKMDTLILCRHVHFAYRKMYPYWKTKKGLLQGMVEKWDIADVDVWNDIDKNKISNIEKLNFINSFLLDETCTLFFNLEGEFNDLQERLNTLSGKMQSVFSCEFSQLTALIQYLETSPMKFHARFHDYYLKKYVPLLLMWMHVNPSNNNKPNNITSLNPRLTILEKLHDFSFEVQINPIKLIIFNNQESNDEKLQLLNRVFLLKNYNLLKDLDLLECASNLPSDANNKHVEIFQIILNYLDTFYSSDKNQVKMFIEQITFPLNEDGKNDHLQIIATTGKLGLISNICTALQEKNKLELILPLIEQCLFDKTNNPGECIQLHRLCLFAVKQKIDIFSLPKLQVKKNTILQIDALFFSSSEFLTEFPKDKNAVFNCIKLMEKGDATEEEKQALYKKIFNHKPMPLLFLSALQFLFKVDITLTNAENRTLASFAIENKNWLALCILKKNNTGLVLHELDISCVYSGLLHLLENNEDYKYMLSLYREILERFGFDDINTCLFQSSFSNGKSKNMFTEITLKLVILQTIRQYKTTEKELARNKEEMINIFNFLLDIFKDNYFTSFCNYDSLAALAMVENVLETVKNLADLSRPELRPNSSTATQFLKNEKNELIQAIKIQINKTSQLRFEFHCKETIKVLEQYINRPINTNKKAKKPGFFSRGCKETIAKKMIAALQCQKMVKLEPNELSACNESGSKIKNCIDEMDDSIKNLLFPEPSVTTSSSPSTKGT